MTPVDLFEYEDDEGDYVSVWMDDDHETVVVQYNFVHLTLDRDEFEGFVEALIRARDVLEDELE